MRQSMNYKEINKSIKRTARKSKREWATRGQHTPSDSSVWHHISRTTFHPLLLVFDFGRCPHTYNLEEPCWRHAINRPPWATKELEHKGRIIVVRNFVGKKRLLLVRNLWKHGICHHFRDRNDMLTSCRSAQHRSWCPSNTFFSSSASNRICRSHHFVSCIITLSHCHRPFTF